MKHGNVKSEQNTIVDIGIAVQATVLLLQDKLATGRRPQLSHYKEVRGKRQGKRRHKTTKTNKNRAPTLEMSSQEQKSKEESIAAVLRRRAQISASVTHHHLHHIPDWK